MATTLPWGQGQALEPEPLPRAHDDAVPGRLSISVVIAWVNPLELLVPGLEALERQRGGRPDEVIVVTRRGEHERRRLRSLYPAIDVVSASPGTPITALRGEGLRRAQGQIVAVTEDHCVPCDEWIATIERTMLRGDCGVVGGPVENASTGRLRDWAAFLTEYAPVVKPAADGAGSQPLPGNNVAYRRELTAGLCATLDRGLWESYYHERLIERGVPMRFDSRMLVYHRRPFGFRYFVGQRYHFCRSFAGMRCQSFSASDRLKYGVGSVLLPPLLLLRGLLALSRKRRLVARYLACLPLIATYVSVGALGEMIGYFLGGGDSLARVE